MRRFHCMLVALGLLGAITYQSWAGDEANAILEKAAKAHAPKGEGKKNTAYYGKNKGTIHVAGLELEFTGETWLQPPGKFKEVVNMSVMNKDVKVTTVFNGKEGWIKANDQEIKVEKEILSEFHEIAYMMSLAQLTGLKEKGMKFSLLGEVKINGKAAVGVKISKEGKKDIDFFFDKATGLMAKTQRRTRDLMTGEEVTEERIILAYKDVEGKKMPKTVQVNRDGKKFLAAEVVEAKMLEKIDDAEFAQP